MLVRYQDDRLGRLGSVPIETLQCDSGIRSSELQNGIHVKHEAPSFMQEVKHNKAIRFRFVLSVLVAFAFMVMGYNSTQIGPALPDLMEIANIDLEKGSSIMTTYFSGRLVGSGLGGILYSKVNTYLMFMISLISDAVVVAAIPWCVSYEMMMSTHALHGISLGVLNTVIISTSMQLWDSTIKGRIYIQIMYVLLAVSHVLAPVGTAPFLNEVEYDSDNIADSTTPGGSFNQTLCCSGNDSNINNTANRLLQETFQESVNPPSVLYIAYSISSGITLSSSIPFIILYILNVNRVTVKPTNESSHFRGDLSRMTNCLQLINIGVFSGTYSVIGFCFQSYFTVFSVQYLNWKKTSGAMLTSVFFFSRLSGRVIGIFLVRVMSSHKMLLLLTTFHTLGIVCLTVCAYLHVDTGVWVSVCITGLASSIIWPSALSWVNVHLIPVNGKVSGYLLVLSYLCTLLISALLGYLMQQVSLLWLCFATLIASTITVVNVIIMYIHTICFTRKKANTYNVQISIIQ